MKKVYDYWLPDSDQHFERLIKKRIKQGGPAEYQDDVRTAAYKYVEDFETVVDVGANVGFWSKPLSYKFNKILAFEPVEIVRNCLIENTKDINIEIFDFALGNVNSIIDIEYNPENTGASTVSKESLGKGSIEIKKLDSLNLPKFGLLKVDCERYDLEVLKGAEETLLKYKPIVVVEQHPDTIYSAGKFLKTLGAVEKTNVRKDYIFGWE